MTEKSVPEEATNGLPCESTACGPRCGRWRFSLRAVLFLTLVAALLLGSLLTYWRMRRAERELQVVRDEMGYLAIGDPSLVHVVALNVNEAMTWRWRVHLPKGHKYRWKVAHGPVPAQGVPQKATWTCVSNEPYWETGVEALVTVSLRRDGADKWALTLSSRSGGTKWQLGGGTVTIPDAHMRPLLEAGSIEESHLGSRGTEALTPGEAIILLKRHVRERTPSGGSPTMPMPGIMIWLEEYP